MTVYNTTLTAKVRLIWKLITLFIGFIITLALYARGRLYQGDNLYSSILISLGALVILITLLNLFEFIRQREFKKFSSIRFRLFLVLSLFAIYGIFYLVNPALKFFDLLFLLIQAFIFSAFAHSLSAKIFLDQNGFTLRSFTGVKKISWEGISSIRWIDKGTIALFAMEYPREVLIPLFTFTKRVKILHFFHTFLRKDNSNIDYFVRELFKGN